MKNTFRGRVEFIEAGDVVFWRKKDFIDSDGRSLYPDATLAGISVCTIDGVELKHHMVLPFETAGIFLCKNDFDWPVFLVPSECGTPNIVITGFSSFARKLLNSSVSVEIESV